MSTSEAPTDSTSAQSIGVSATSDAATIRGRVDAVVSSTSRPSLQSQASAVPPRIQKELAMLARDPGPGISAWPATPGATHELLGQIVGPEESPYRGGTFAVSITLPQRYPFEPPSVRFITPIYHPNIDSEGRVCLDTLKMQPQGSWSPSININTLLLTIRVLMASPNANDGLVASITEQYRRNVEDFNRSAREHTLQHAMQPVAPQGPVLDTTAGSGGASPAKLEADGPSRTSGAKRAPVRRSDDDVSSDSASSEASTSSSRSSSDGSDSDSDDSSYADPTSNRSNDDLYGPTKRPKFK